MLARLMTRKALLAVLALALSAACRNEPAPSQATVPTAAPSVQHETIRDPHSFSRPEEVRVEHIALDLQVDFAKKCDSRT